MKTSSSSWSFHRTMDKGLDLMGFVQQCADLGLDGVELLGRHFKSTRKDYLVSLKKACTDRFLTIAMVSAGGHLSIGDDAKRAAEVEDIRKWTEVAAFMGAPLVRFFCGSGQELHAGGRELYAKVLAAMKQVAELGRQYGIVMALENHGGTTADQVLSLIRDVDSPFVKLTLDTGNFPPAGHVGPLTYASIERCAPHAAIVHAKFFNVRPDGTDADFDWPRKHGILRAAGFNGFLSVEYEGDEGDEPAVMKRIAPYLKTLR